MGQHLLRLAAEDHGGQAAAAVRGHYDQVAALVLRCMDYGLPGVVVTRPDSLHPDASCLGSLPNEGEVSAASFSFCSRMVPARLAGIRPRGVFQCATAG
jgi:hypothetical protein